MNLCETIFQKQFASKFSAYYNIDLEEINHYLIKLIDIEKLVVISLIDVESELTLSAYGQNRLTIDTLTKESINIYRSTQRMMGAYNSGENHKLLHTFIGTTNEYSFTIPFHIKQDRVSLLYVEVKNNGTSAMIVKKRLEQTINLIKDKHV